jgi:hypothetical protein
MWTEIFRTPAGTQTQTVPPIVGQFMYITYYCFDFQRVSSYLYESYLWVTHFPLSWKNQVQVNIPWQAAQRMVPPDSRLRAPLEMTSAREPVVPAPGVGRVPHCNKQQTEYRAQTASQHCNKQQTVYRAHTASQHCNKQQNLYSKYSAAAKPCKRIPMLIRT